MMPFGLAILSGASGSGKTIFAQQYAYEVLQDNGRVLWITTEELPQTIRASMLRFGWQIDRYESEGKFQFVDAVSPARLGLSENIGGGVLGLDPTGMLIVVSEQLKQMVSSQDLGKFLVVLDSVSRLLLSCETKSVIDFISCLSSRLENYKTRGIATVSEGAHDEKILNALTFSSIGTFRFRILESGEQRSRQLRIETLKGRRHDDKWKNYTITNTGLDIEV
ncbi:MAG: RAD55 family ATPase [Nitrososphaerales archaeon]|jgi:circadian clock protein KaiC